MKRFLLTVFVLLFGSIVFADTNSLNAVQIEGTDDGYNIVLKTDTIPKVNKKSLSSDNIILTVKGIITSDTVRALYKSTNAINSLIMETVSDDELKIYVNAPDIANSTILAETSDGNLTILNEKFPVDKFVWTGALFFLFVFILKSFKSVIEYENSITIKKDIKNREIELYRNFQKELSGLPSINCKINNIYATNIMPRSRRKYKELSRL